MEMFQKYEKDIDRIVELPPSNAEHLTSTFSKNEILLPNNNIFESGENDPKSANKIAEEEEKK